MMFEGSSDQFVTVSGGVRLRVRTAGNGPAVLLLHGYPQTHVCWHRVAPLLVAAGFTVIVSDLRGYGDSDKPSASDDHETYSKRVMAADQVEMMAKLGFDSFFLAGHDRGARVSHRLGLDHPGAVRRMAVLDIAPTQTMYVRTNREFATGYYHWFFLIQPAPFPERLIGADPEFFLRHKLAAWSQGNMTAFSEEAIGEYVRCFSDAVCIAATCEDYRAAATIDLVHDAQDRDRRLDAPLLTLWGGRGLVHRLYDVTAVWREKARDVEGYSLPCGHFLPEEKPAETARALIDFFGRD